jgi:putative NADH-flavin reductase
LAAQAEENADIASRLRYFKERIMKVAIFGASGRAGGLLTRGCLEAGHQVTALVRTPATFVFRDRVRVVEGSALDPGAVFRTVEGADVVLSALGARSLKKEDVLERAVPLMVQSMQAAGVQRIIVLGSAGALSDSLKKQPAWRRWFVQTIVYNTVLKWAVASQIAQWKVLSASGLGFTMVMPPMLMDSPARGTYRVDGEALPPGGSRISRADVAEFMIAQIGTPEWVGKGVYISW